MTLAQKIEQVLKDELKPEKHKNCGRNGRVFKV